MSKLCIAGQAVPYLQETAKCLGASFDSVVFAPTFEAFEANGADASVLILTDTMNPPTAVEQAVRLLLQNPQPNPNIFGALSPNAPEALASFFKQNRIRYLSCALCTPVQLASLIQEAMTPVYFQPADQSPSSMMIAIHSPKGGVGKTSLAIELAETLALRLSRSPWHLPVCLVDMNPSFDTMTSTLSCIRNSPNTPCLTDWVDAIEAKIFASMTPEQVAQMEADEQHSFVPFLKEDSIDFSREEVFSLLAQDPQTGLFILPTVALPLDVKFVQPAYIRLVLRALRPYFPYILVDTGNNIGFFTLESLHEADEILLVTTPSGGSNAVMQKLTTNIGRLGLDGQKLNLVINSPNGKAGSFDPARIASGLHLSLIGVVPYDEGLRQSHEQGISYSLSRPNTDYAFAMNVLAAKICPALANSMQTSRPAAAPRLQASPTKQTDSAPAKKRWFRRRKSR